MAFAPAPHVVDLFNDVGAQRVEAPLHLIEEALDEGRDLCLIGICAQIALCRSACHAVLANSVRLLKVPSLFSPLSPAA